MWCGKPVCVVVEICRQVWYHVYVFIDTVLLPQVSIKTHPLERHTTEPHPHRLKAKDPFISTTRMKIIMNLLISINHTFKLTMRDGQLQRTTSRLRSTLEHHCTRPFGSPSMPVMHSRYLVLHRDHVGGGRTGRR